ERAPWPRFPHHAISRSIDRRPAGIGISAQRRHSSGDLPAACKMKSAVATKEQSKPASAKKPKRIVIVDDHPLFRKGLEQLINSSDDRFTICGEAGDA